MVQQVVRGWYCRWYWDSAAGGTVGGTGLYIAVVTAVGRVDNQSNILSFEKILPHPANSIYLLMHVTSKQIELEGPGWSALVKF